MGKCEENSNESFQTKRSRRKIHFGFENNFMDTSIKNDIVSIKFYVFHFVSEFGVCLCVCEWKHLSKKERKKISASRNITRCHYNEM